MVDGIIWICSMCGESIVQPFHWGWSSEQIRHGFTSQVDAHVDFHTDFLMDELRAVLSGQERD